MFPGKTLITGILIILAVIAGCSKKKDSKDGEFSSSKTAADQNKSTTQDIFDEFYKEDSTAPENLSSPEPPPSRYTGPVSFSENGRYVVQVSTVASRSLADNLSDKLNGRGWPSYVAEVQNPTPELPGTYYRIRIGGFNRVSDARSFGENTLTAEGYEFWVDNRSNDNVGLEGYGMGSGTETYSNESSTQYQSSTTYPDESGTVYSPEPPPPAPAAPAPEPATAPPPPPPPASEYTPESAEKEFGSEEESSGTSEQPSSSSTSEWGNDEW
jgi:hypothetical protein